MDKSIGEYEKILEKFLPVFLFASGKDEDKKVIMDARKAISPSLRKYGDLKINNDIAVPVDKIPRMLSFLGETSLKYDIPIINFGHFGDGNIHVNIMLDKSNGGMVQKGERAKYDILKKASFLRKQESRKIDEPIKLRLKNLSGVYNILRVKHLFNIF